ncbi:DNA repair protein XRCC1 [Trichinella sp. T9]|nr:DNA repair protein XRCC1 [Trichinella sp. T9]
MNKLFHNLIFANIQTQLDQAWLASIAILLLAADFDNSVKRRISNSALNKKKRNFLLCYGTEEYFYTGAYIVQNYDVPILPHPNELYEKVKLWLEMTINMDRWKICCAVLTDLGCLQLASADKAVAIIQLKQLERIDGIDIRNQNSAFIEIHVARSDDDFRILLPKTEFMTPAESKVRRYKHKNRMKFFTKKDFIPSAAEQCWDRVKIICYQPFRSIAYGISFIRVKRLVNEDDSLLENGIYSREFRSRFSVRRLPSPPLADKWDHPHCYQSEVMRGDWTADRNIQIFPRKFRCSDILFGIQILFVGFEKKAYENLCYKVKKMGAKIQSNWKDFVTHIVFNPDTDFSEIQLYIGQSYIVKAEWIEECFACKRHLCVQNYLHDLEKLEQQHMEAMKVAEMAEFEKMEKVEELLKDHENSDGTESVWSWDSIYEKETESGSDSGESLYMDYRYYRNERRDEYLCEDKILKRTAIEAPEEVDISPGFVTECEEEDGKSAIVDYKFFAAERRRDKLLRRNRKLKRLATEGGDLSSDFESGAKKMKKTNDNEVADLESS